MAANGNRDYTNQDEKQFPYGGGGGGGGPPKSNGPGPQGPDVKSMAGGGGGAGENIATTYQKSYNTGENKGTNGINGNGNGNVKVNGNGAGTGTGTGNGNSPPPMAMPMPALNGKDKQQRPPLQTIVLGPKNAECISKDGMVCCPCSEGIKYSYFAPTQCYVPMEYYVPVQCCVPVECEIRYGTPFIPGKDNPAANCN